MNNNGKEVEIEKKELVDASYEERKTDVIELNAKEVEIEKKELAESPPSYEEKKIDVIETNEKEVEIEKKELAESLPSYEERKTDVIELNGKEVEIEIIELAEALTYYEAGKNNVIEKVEAVEAGRKGAFITDIAHTFEKYANGEITIEEAEKELVEKTASYVVLEVVSKAVDITAELIKDPVKTRLSAAQKLIETLKEPIKHFVIEKITSQVTEVPYKRWDKTKTLIKKAPSAVIPFFVGEKKISSLEELKELLKTEPEALIPPLQDGRLEKFLKSFDQNYLDCLKKDNPEQTLKCLAELLGIEITKEIKKDSVSLIQTPQELLKALEEKNETIYLAKGNFEFDKLSLNYPVKIIGQGKNETFIRTKTLILTSPEIKLENLTLEGEICFYTHKKFEKENLLFKKYRKVEPKELEVVETFTKPAKINVVENLKKVDEHTYIVDKEIVLEEDTSLINLHLKFEKEGCIIIKNAKFYASGCKFEPSESHKNIFLKAEGSSLLYIHECAFTNAKIGITLSGSSKAKIEKSSFEKNNKGIEIKGTSLLEVISSSFVENKDDKGTGLGILLSGSSKAKIKKSSFEKNNIGIEATKTSLLEVEKSLFKKNNIGIETNANSLLEVEKTTFEKNDKGIEATKNSLLEVEKTTFEKNNKGIEINDNSQLEVEKSSFKKNNIGIEINANSLLEVEKSTFEKNSKAIYRKTSGLFTDSQVKTSDCSFIDNEIDIEK